MLIKSIRRKFKAIRLVGLAIIILSVTNCSDSSKVKTYEYGVESRLVASLIPMDCNEDNIAIYNQYVAYRLNKLDYELNNFNSRLGVDEFFFSIKIKAHLDNIKFLKTARISICENGKLYIGRPLLAHDVMLPPECHFYYKLDTLNYLSFTADGELKLGSIKYTSQENYLEELIYDPSEMK